jgi:serine/threonine-protein kinase
VAYWLLTGQTVFEGETPLDIIVKHVQEQPVPPSERTELEIPSDLEAVVLHCLAKDPEERPRTALDLATALAACDVGVRWEGTAAQEWWALHTESVGPAPGAV